MPTDDFERITSPLAMRAVSHPVRIALLEALRERGPLTAAQAADIVGESPANCSFHLRTLAKYGFVEEADGGRGRRRPWRVVPGPRTILADEELGQEAGIASEVLLSAMIERAAVRHKAWLGARRQYPKEWRAASLFSTMTLHLTVDELQVVNEQIVRLLEPFFGREPDPDAVATVPVSVVVQAFPLRTPEGGEHGEGRSRSS